MWGDRPTESYQNEHGKLHDTLEMLQKRRLELDVFPQDSALVTKTFSNQRDGLS
jgi:hypothetical protein